MSAWLLLLIYLMFFTAMFLIYRKSYRFAYRVNIFGLWLILGFVIYLDGKETTTAFSFLLAQNLWIVDLRRKDNVSWDCQKI